MNIGTCTHVYQYMSIYNLYNSFQLKNKVVEISYIQVYISKVQRKILLSNLERGHDITVHILTRIDNNSKCVAL